MNKKEVAAYFDRQAPTWDAHMVTDNEKIRLILDAAGVKRHSCVLDVACGTGVLFPYYLDRDVSRVIGVDLSPEMARIAARKQHDPRVEVICGDIEALPVHLQCDCCVVYNAFPHFEHPAQLIARLAQWVKPGGRLTVAHGMGLDALRRHHAGRAEQVSREMLAPDVLAGLFSPWFDVFVAQADEGKYLVAGKRKDAAVEPAADSIG